MELLSYSYDCAMLISHHRRMNRLRMLRFLNRMGSAKGSAISLYFPPGMPPSEVREMIENINYPKESLPNLIELVSTSPTGALVLWGEQYKFLAKPPFPIEAKGIYPGYAVEIFRSLLQRKIVIALILIRLGAYAIGVFEIEKRLSSKVGTGLIHSRHKKGGSSQRRFERHREKQMEMFFGRVCSHVRENLEPYAKQLDYVIYGGERNTLLAFRKQCQFLGSFDDRVSESRLNVRTPRQPALETAVSEVWSSELIEWIEGPKPLGSPGDL